MLCEELNERFSEELVVGEALSAPVLLRATDPCSRDSAIRMYHHPAWLPAVVSIITNMTCNVHAHAQRWHVLSRLQGALA